MQKIKEWISCLDFREDILPTIVKIAVIIGCLVIGLVIGRNGNNAAYQAKIESLQNELTTLQTQKESFVSLDNEDSLIMVLIDNDYQFLTTNEFQTISDSLPHMKARKFILLDRTSNKKMIELENQQLNAIYQEMGKLEALTDPDYYRNNLSHFPQLASYIKEVETEYKELITEMQNGTVSEADKTRREKEIKITLQEMNNEYPVNGYQWTIQDGYVTLDALI